MTQRRALHAGAYVMKESSKGADGVDCVLIATGFRSASGC